MTENRQECLFYDNERIKYRDSEGLVQNTHFGMTDTNILRFTQKDRKEERV